MTLKTKTRDAIEALRYVSYGLRRHVAGVCIASVISAFTEAAVIAGILCLVGVITTGKPFSVSTSLWGRPISVTLTANALFAITATALLLRASIQVLFIYLNAKITTLFEARMRRDIFAAFLHASASVQSRERLGRLHTVLVDHLPHGTMMLHSAVGSVGALLSFSVLVTTAMALQPIAALTVLAIAVGLFYSVRPITIIARRHGSRKTQLNVEFSTHLAQTILNTREIQIFGVGSAIIDTMNKRIAEVCRGRIVAKVLMESIAVVYQNAAAVILLGGLAFVHYSGMYALPSLAAVVLLVLRSLTYSQQVQVSYHVVMDNAPFVEEVRNTFEHYQHARRKHGKARLDTAQLIRCENVDFYYQPEKPVLRGVSFSASTGESIGIIGPSASGKSTLVSLLLRLRTPTSGSVMVNDLDANQYVPDDWTKNIAFVPQEPQLLNMTVAENIRFFRNDLDDARIKDAAQLAGIHDEILQLPLGYDNPVGERGSSLSGGQRQRICIARALVGNPSVLILDEPTSALDIHSEERIQTTLQKIKGNLILFIVAHRLSTLNFCDKIMILRDGEIRGFDTPAKLEEADVYYSDALRLSNLH